MKNNFILTGFLIMAFCWQGCSGFLTVDVPDSLEKANYWKSREHATAALTGVYTKLGENLPILFKWGGLRSEIYDLFLNTGNEQQFVDQDIRITNGLCNWSEVYVGINWTNSVIKNAHLVMEHDRSFTREDLDELLGQAYAIRALYYFYLVRTFKDVPYHTEPYESDKQSPYAAAVPEQVVLDSIEADLGRALVSAPEKFARPEQNCGFITRNAVRAIWADVKLWRQKYQECVTLCDELAGEYDNKLMTWDTWFSIFATGNSRETIFEYQYLDEGPASPLGPVFSQQVAANQNAFLYNVRKVYPQMGGYVSSDTVRLPRTTMGSGSSSLFKDYVFKFAGISADNHLYVFRDVNGLNKINFIFYRYREVMLMKAEALGMLGQYDQAVEEINKIRRATALEAITAEEMGKDEVFLDRLICEIRAELAFEGKDWFTVLRIARNTGYNDLMIVRIGEHSSSPIKQQTLKARLENPESWFLPYLESEVDNNLLLTQKEYYKGRK